MINTQITNGKGSKHKALVTDDSLLVINQTYPPLLPQKIQIFRQYLTDDGTSTGSNDMRVDGSTTPVEFWIPADDDNDRYITQVSFLIADAGATLNEFGNIGALTNGCEFEYTSIRGTVVIHESLISNFDFVRLCNGNPAFGSGNDVFKANNVSGLSEGFIPIFDFTKLLPPYGLKLDAGSVQKLILRVNDDTTGIDQFDAVAFGFERFE